MPRWTREIAAGRGSRPPATSNAGLFGEGGAQNGRTATSHVSGTGIPLTELIFVGSSVFGRLSGGMFAGNVRAGSIFPDLGGPLSNG